MEAIGVTRIDGAHFESGATPFQSQYWAQIKSRYGWTPYFFSITHGQVVESLLVLVRTFPLGRRLAYVPFAPGGFTSGSFLEALSAKLKVYLPRNTFLIRYDLPWSTLGADFASVPLKVCPESVQPVTTVRIDISQSFEMLQKYFRSRCNRNIKKAEQDGLHIVEWKGDEKMLYTWYDLYLTTARRDGFAPRSFPYIKDIVSLNASDVQPRLYLVYNSRSEMCSGIIVLQGRCEAVYLLGASDRKTDNRGASHLVQVHAMREAQLAGCSVYDLHGISEGAKGSGHLGSLDLFKTSFGGEIVNRVPTLDFPLRKIEYSFFTFLEEIRYKKYRKSHS